MGTDWLQLRVKLRLRDRVQLRVWLQLRDKVQLRDWLQLRDKVQLRDVTKEDDEGLDDVRSCPCCIKEGEVGHEEAQSCLSIT